MATNVDVKTNPTYSLNGVDVPWFTLSKGAGDTVTWKNTATKTCTLSFGSHSPFPRRHYVLAPGENTGPLAGRYPSHPGGTSPGAVYKVYKYTVEFDGGEYFDPGWGVTP